MKSQSSCHGSREATTIIRITISFIARIQVYRGLFFSRFLSLPSLRLALAKPMLVVGLPQAPPQFLITDNVCIIGVGIQPVASSSPIIVAIGLFRMLSILLLSVALLGITVGNMLADETGDGGLVVDAGDGGLFDSNRLFRNPLLT